MLMLSEQAISDIEELQEILSRIKSGTISEMYAPGYLIADVKRDALSMLDFVFAETWSV